ncbi:aprataxin [Cryptococcus deuterogattii 99/473]|uniref:Aprataxin n=2 Tax=Cryptococcus deuterogattii TaxID=1859096 RepID=A0A0D0V7I3_9TREE|nr:aprataxin [Cryptococcus deuterogattii LA55]KIR36905.1 aprataxin [Cryptococcus deuterogattii MMRL2647]KIR43376.1 aprataxin [Cryptococcus deuterogattii Ram5]KIR74709.1 aprataxin [Cryptococcus deuterogattii CA1014]KIR92364.1 aprataxin [Cryptococcus deuterogattii CBS 10090]KIS01530.1 aprataxin [Cryptococcus deuterogattii 2001/935-1]KIY57208.1 aprataxin [Cryptococcus deuterogattii 99/473]
MASHPLLALRQYATLSDPQSSLPPSKLLFSNSNTMVVFDAYPKAKYHFLVLPRYPFPPQSDPDSDESIVSIETLDDLKSLLLKAGPDEREEIIRAMAETAREVEEMIKDEMLKTEGFEWRIDVGFHAIPSMKHIHLHVISEDRISPSLKSKKHYNSFRPDLGFFIPIMEVQRWLQDDRTMLDRVETLSATQTLLKTPLTCFKCDEPMNNIEKLKQHFEKEFSSERNEALKYIAKHGRQRASDEEVF